MSAATPISTERIRRLLSGRDVHFGEYSDSELACPARNAVYFWNASNPQILQLRAQWRGIAEDDAQFTALADEVSRCNATRTGPKSYLAPFEDGTRYGLVAECNVVATSGLTQAQLTTFFETSMSMIMGFFADLETCLPDFVTWEGDADTDPQER
ncbi:YbjN domain-containing protein [Actinomyces sp. B33]|uniref:YbjN domain-containing protein n=1 Tax=Actinomyces sp. B33 TaxID=2942131 RepID=UPI0023418116|nr:YbjN domain-containing protein [Actinomyces sp. B33]MDC4233408.1 YbjN domain-containing protein [Actinomyces sp. B33]